MKESKRREKGGKQSNKGMLNFTTERPHNDIIINDRTPLLLLNAASSAAVHTERMHIQV